MSFQSSHLGQLQLEPRHGAPVVPIGSLAGASSVLFFNLFLSRSTTASESGFFALPCEIFLSNKCLVRYCPLLNKDTMTAPVASSSAPKKRCLQPLAKSTVEEADRATRHHWPHDGIVVGILVYDSETSEELLDFLEVDPDNRSGATAPTNVHLSKAFLPFACCLSLPQQSLLTAEYRRSSQSFWPFLPYVLVPDSYCRPFFLTYVPHAVLLRHFSVSPSFNCRIRLRSCYVRAPRT